MPLPKPASPRLLKVAPALIAAAGLVATLAIAQETIHVQVRLVHILATVKDKAGQPIGGLQKSDFLISDNGVPQEISLFERQTSQPLSVALMIDTSGSTAKDLKFEIDSATRFMRALLGEGNPADSISLWSFDYNITQETGFTRRLDVLESKLRLIHGEAGTSLYDAIWYGAHDLESRQGRKVMVLVTDGGNTTGRRDSHEALEALHMADAVMFPIVVLPITNDAGRNRGGENVLSFMAQGTGGRSFVPQLSGELDRAFHDIISDLRTEYLLGFYPKDVPPSKERFHKLLYRLRDPGLQVSARTGYYDDSGAAPETPDARIRVDPVRPPKK